MMLEDFTDGEDGYCATGDIDGKEFILSEAFTEGSHGVGKAVRKIVHQFETIPTIGIRFHMLQAGIEAEQNGMRLTAKAPPATVLVKREFGVKRGMSKKKTGVALSMLLTFANMMMKENNSRQDKSEETKQ